MVFAAVLNGDTGDWRTAGPSAEGGAVHLEPQREWETHLPDRGSCFAGPLTGEVSHGTVTSYENARHVSDLVGYADCRRVVQPQST